MIINENRLHGSLKILENKTIQMSKDPKYILDGATLKFDKQPITITKTESDRIEGTIHPTLVDGAKLNAAINPNATSFMQWNGNPPDTGGGLSVIDISEAQNGSIITWFNPPDASGDFGKPGEQHYWSKYDGIYMNPDSSYAFANKQNLTYIGLYDFDTSHVTNMSGMFKNIARCQLDANFNTSNVTDMRYMFQNSDVAAKTASIFVNTSILNMDKEDNTNGTYFMFNGTPSNTIKPEWNGTWNADGTFILSSTTVRSTNNGWDKLPVNIEAEIFTRSSTPPDTGGGLTV